MGVRNEKRLVAVIYLMMQFGQNPINKFLLVEFPKLYHKLLANYRDGLTSIHPSIICTAYPTQGQGEPGAYPREVGVHT